MHSYFSLTSSHFHFRSFPVLNIDTVSYDPRYIANVHVRYIYIYNTQKNHCLPCGIALISFQKTFNSNNVVCRNDD